ncbi:MAG TPA: site-2 protease family protein [Kofleriaceae bacterium]|nr:site-2 protease family protein [Kofleriaceae bacterium]
MFRSFRLGRIAGFPIDVNPSFLLLLAIVALTMGGLAGVIAVLIAFASVIAHELGHALVARRLHVRVAGIELHFFGGAAKIVDQPRTPRDEIAIAAAGPAVSFAIAGVSLLLAQVALAPLFGGLAWINLLLGAFNLIPAFPMDGGRILRALLTPRLGHMRATEVAVVLARGFAVALGIYGLFTFTLYLMALGVLLWIMSTAELQVARAVALPSSRVRWTRGNFI